MGQQATPYVVEERRRWRAATLERFDRLEFAVRALDVLRPRATRVAIYSCRSDIKVEQGRDLERGGRARWATVGIPPDATREAIALALVELTGASGKPYVLETLLALPAAECKDSGLAFQ